MNVAVAVAAANVLNAIMDDEEEEPILQQEIWELFLSKDRGEKPPRILNYFEITIPSLSDKSFQANFRVTRETFQVLLTAVAPLLAAKPNAHKPTLNAEKQVLMVIWLLATPDSYRSVGERFDVAKSTLWACFIRVINALNQVAPQFIQWPEPEQRRSISTACRRFGDLPHIVGAIDGTYVPISAPRAHAVAYINRKCFHGITLQAIGVPSLKFIDCFTGYPSSVSDIRIFRNSEIHQKIFANPESYFTEDEYIIGDKAYPVYKWCIAPYINRGNLTATQIRFNSMQTKSRQVIERVFALYFGRLRRMRYLDLHRDDLYASTIIAACVLHNICLLNPDDEVDNYIDEGRPVLQQIAEQNNNPVARPANHVELHVTEQGRQRRDQLAQGLQRRQR